MDGWSEWMVLLLHFIMFSELQDVIVTFDRVTETARKFGQVHRFSTKLAEMEPGGFGKGRDNEKPEQVYLLKRFLGVQSMSFHLGKFKNPAVSKSSRHCQEGSGG